MGALDSAIHFIGRAVVQKVLHLCLDDDCSINLPWKTSREMKKVPEVAVVHCGSWKIKRMC